MLFIKNFLVKAQLEQVKEQQQRVKYEVQLQQVQLMPPHSLPNIIQMYYQNEPKFNGVYSRKNLPKIKDGAYVINLDEYESIGTHWIVLYVNGNNNAIYFEFLKNKNIITNIYRIQAYNSIMCM